MYAYHTPGVIFEWRDTRARDIDILRTDIAGFVGIAERGPLHRPLKVESWTQFTSLFGGYIPQGYLAYAVQGFFANGGQTCWVVRVADPDRARPARLVLFSNDGRPTLELTAAHRHPEGRGQARVLALASASASRPDPGTWAHKLSVSVTRSGRDRFSLIVRLAGGAPEIWRNLSMDMKDRQGRYVESVLNHPATGSHLVSVRCLAPAPSSSLDSVPSPQAPNLRNGIGWLAGGQDGLAPALDLKGADQQPRLRLVAKTPTTTNERITASVEPDSEGRFKLSIQLAGQPDKSWPNLTVEPPYIDLFDDTGRQTLRLTAASLERREIEVVVVRSGLDRFDLVVRALDGGAPETWRNLTMDPGEPDYVEKVINEARAGSLLVRARDLLDSYLNPPAAAALNLRNGRGRLGYGPPQLDLLDAAGRPTLQLTAPVYAGAGIQVAVARSRAGADRFDLTLRSPDGLRIEIWADLSMQLGDPRHVEEIVNDRETGSQLVQARALGQNTPDPDRSRRAAWFPERVYAAQAINDPHSGSKLVAAYDIPSEVRAEMPNLIGGTFALAGGLDPLHFYLRRNPIETSWGIATFELVDEISMVAMPDIMPKPWVSVAYKPQPPRCDDLNAEPPLLPLSETPPEYPPRFDDDPQIRALQYELIGHCERLKDRMAILDPRVDDTTPERVLGWRTQGGFDTTFAALYYPWIMVPDPLRLEGLLRALPPSGHIAGIYARVDQLAGVHKPPANQALENVLDIAPTYVGRLRLSSPNGPALGDTKDTRSGIDDIIHGVLNDKQINVIRPYPGRGVRVAGARLLSSDTEIRFVNVRRLLLMIEEAIDERTQWIVFEPNNPSLWLDIERAVSSFLNSLWRRGMLDGATAEDAYSVRCDAATNPPEETALGRVICEIGLQPPWPAEFVIVRIGKTENGAVELDGNRS